MIPPGTSTNRSWRDRIWMFVAGALAVAYAVSFTIGQFRGVSTNQNTANTASTITVETRYLADVADYANYLAEVDHILCASAHASCPMPPHFPDPDGLPALG